MKKFVYKNAGKPEILTGKTLSGFSLLFFTLLLGMFLPYFAMGAEAASDRHPAASFAVRKGGDTVLSRKAPLSCAVPSHKIHHTGPLLLFSDSPETVDRGGILFQDKVKGKLRVFYHHVNATGENMKLAVLLRPAGNRPVVLTLGTRGVSLPSSNYLRAAKESQENYFTDYAQRRAQWLQTADETAIRRAALELDFSFYRHNKYLKNISLLPGESYELLASVGAGEEGSALTKEDKIRERWQRSGINRRSRKNKRSFGAYPALGESSFSAAVGTAADTTASINNASVTAAVVGAFRNSPFENAGIKVPQGALASGMLDFRVNRLSEVTVLMYPENENPLHYLKTAEKLPFDAHPLRGTFQAADIVYDFGEIKKHGVTDVAADFGEIEKHVVADDEAADPKGVSSEAAFHTIGIALCVQNDAQFLKGREALTGENTEDYGNYGVIYHMRCSSPYEVPASLWVNPQGGVFAGCGLLVKDVKTTAASVCREKSSVNSAVSSVCREKSSVNSAVFSVCDFELLGSKYTLTPIPTGRLCFAESDSMECIYEEAGSPVKGGYSFFYDFLWSPAGASNLPLRFFLLKQP